MSESIEMNVGTSLVLSEVARKILYSVVEENGQKVVVDRPLPFKLSYRLNKIRLALEKDVKWFEDQRLLLFAKYGEEDGDKVTIKDPEKEALFKKEVGDLIDAKVVHEFEPLDPADIVLIEDPDITVSPEAMALFIGYLTNDPEFEKEMEFNITVKNEPKEEQEVKEEPKKKSTKSTTKTETTAKKTTKKKTTKKEEK